MNALTNGEIYALLWQKVKRDDADSIQRLLDSNQVDEGVCNAVLRLAAGEGMAQSVSVLLPYATEAGIDAARLAADEFGHRNCFDLLTAYREKQRLSIAVAPVATAASPTSTRKM